MKTIFKIPLTSLNDQENQIIKECLIATRFFFCDEEFQTLFGITREQVQEIAHYWPDNKSLTDTDLAINNALVNLLGYPHGHWNDSIWHQYISASTSEIQNIFYKLRGQEKPLALYDKESLIQYLDQGNSLEYLFFWEQKKKNDAVSANCFSQWYPTFFMIDHIVYPTAEHYMMAEKARLFQDEQILQKILKSDSPREVKTLGRQIKNFDQTLWEQHRFKIVVTGNTAKFSQNSKLKEFLLSTKNKILVETSPVDSIWGIGLAETDSDAFNPRKWKGHNLLGFALMMTRNNLYYRY